jgi:hypothetical protein
MDKNYRCFFGLAKYTVMKLHRLYNLDLDLDLDLDCIVMQHSPAAIGVSPVAFK